MPTLRRAAYLALDDRDHEQKSNVRCGLSELHPRARVASPFEEFADAIDRQARVYCDFLPIDPSFVQAPNASAKQLRTLERA
jgi:hypothetical protein